MRRVFLDKRKKNTSRLPAGECAVHTKPKLSNHRKDRSDSVPTWYVSASSVDALRSIGPECASVYWYVVNARSLRGPLDALMFFVGETR